MTLRRGITYRPTHEGVIAPAPIPLVSVSGGKDSTATLLVAIERHGAENVRAAFADTGNEHESTYDYVRYLADATGVAIHWLKADFSGEFETKRRNLARIAAGEPESAVYGKRVFMYAWTAEAAAKALELLHPTGNPYLDLCLVRGGFPSRKRQFCTQYLKTEPLTDHALTLIEQHGAVESWQGVRADESASRAKLPEREDQGGGLSVYRPILNWNVAQVFEQHRKHGIKPNPLYSQGMNRVGCMPCINASKGELLEISKRFPAEIERIAEWERLVLAVARPRPSVSFFHMATQGHKGESTSIASVVEWSKTQRGGRMMDWIKVHEEPAACASSYGLCE
jgi:3'-phosphoadenosine 5'-phosphosulfate sulfotransferase (PAPS reductase)/FAD synthetase